MTKIYQLIWPGLTDKVYVGKTSRPLAVRLREHMQPRRWGGALGSALAKYGKPEIVLLEESDPAIANEREMFWISSLSRVPAGYNVLPGGDGGPMPADVRRKIAETSLRFWQSEEGRQLASERGLKTWADPENRSAREAAMRRPDVVERLRKKATEYGARPEVKEAMRRKVIERFSAPGHSEKHGEAVRKGMADPAARTRYENRMTPEAKQRAREGIARSWQDPDARAKRLANLAKARAAPEVRAKMSAAKKAYWAEWRRLKTLKPKEEA